MGKFVGLGIEVGMEDGYVKVIAPIEDSPAYKAGLKPGDLITRLDSTPVKGMTLDDAVKRMRGEPNTKITLTVARKDEDKPLLITITRQEIRVQSVKSKIVEPGYGWVRVSQFQEPTVEDMAKKISALYAQDPNMKGLILDLRNDPGVRITRRDRCFCSLLTERCTCGFYQWSNCGFQSDLSRSPRFLCHSCK